MKQSKIVEHGENSFVLHYSDTFGFGLEAWGTADGRENNCDVEVMREGDLEAVMAKILNIHIEGE